MVHGASLSKRKTIAQHLLSSSTHEFSECAIQPLFMSHRPIQLEFNLGKYNVGVARHFSTL